MATEASQPLKITLVCSIDLAALASTAQYTFVKVATSASSTHYNVGEAIPAATAGDFPIGILQNRPTTAGATCEVVVLGVSKLKMGGTVNPGDPVGVVASSGVGKGQAVTITGSTYTKTAVGRALGSAQWVTGDTGTVVISCLAGNAGT